MNPIGAAKRVRIYVNEGDVVHHQPVHLAILELLRAQGAAGATALRAIEGFGGSGQVHTARVVDTDWKLPIVIEWIDSEERVERILPLVKPLVVRGLITVDETHVALFTPVPLRDVPSALTAADVMRLDFPSVAAAAPLAEVLETLFETRCSRGVTVLEGGRPIGIVTGSDLATRAPLPAHPLLLGKEEAAAVVASSPLRAKDVMTSPAFTVTSAAPLVEVAAAMARRRLKRVPVVDEHGVQVGLVRRRDVLRTVAERFDVSADELPALHVGAQLDRAMHTDVPVVHRDTPLEVVVQGVIATALDCAIVVDEERRPLGIVTGGELLERVTPALRPSALRSLVHRLPFAHPSAKTAAEEQHATARTAGDLMSAELPTLPRSATLSEAIAATSRSRHRLAAVVDADRRLLGILDHDDILRALVEPQ